jgi:hypothetical protein
VLVDALVVIGRSTTPVRIRPSGTRPAAEAEGGDVVLAGDRHETGAQAEACALTGSGEREQHIEAGAHIGRSRHLVETPIQHGRAAAAPGDAVDEPRCERMGTE